VKRKQVHQFTEVDGASCLAFSPDGKELAIGLSGGIVFYKLGETVEVKYSISLLRLSDTARGLAYSPNGKSIAIVGGAAGLFLWDTESKKLLGDSFGQTDGGCRGVAFSPDGRTVAVGGAHGTNPVVLLFDVASLVEKPKPPPKPCPDS
jgi:WD40 repeat protein